MPLTATGNFGCLVGELDAGCTGMITRNSCVNFQRQRWRETPTNVYINNKPLRNGGL